MIKILVAEDDDILQRAYATILRREGFEVYTASDGEQALNIATEQNPQLILLDIQMPKMNGIDFLKNYDLSNKHPDVYVIVFSNDSTDEKADEAMSLGAKKYLLKSAYTPREMVNLVKEVLPTNSH